MKRVISIIAILAIMMSLMVMPSIAEKDIALSIDGVDIALKDTKPYLNKDGRVMVPLSAIGTILKAETTWNASMKKVTIKLGVKEVVVQIASGTAYVNKKAVKMDTQAVIYKSRTYVPLRFISQAFDRVVEWEPDSKTVFVMSRRYLESIKDRAYEDRDITLTLWSPARESDAFSPAYTKALQDFETANPDVRIKHETFEYDSYRTKIKTAAFANNLPDLFYSWGGEFSKPFVESEKVLPLDKYYTAGYKEQLPKAVLTYLTYDGKIYGSTYTTLFSSLFYNKKIFAENGLKAPATFEELVSVSKKLLEKGMTPIGISGKDTWVLAMTHDALTVKSAGSQKVISALQKKEQSYDDPDFLASAKKFKQLIDMGAFYKGAAELSYDEASSLFLKGKVAMFTTGSWMAGTIQSKAKNFADFDVVPYPVTSANAKSTDFVGGAVDAIMVSNETKNPDIAAKAAFELTRSISKYAYLDGTGLPVWKKDYDDSKVNPMSRKLSDYVSTATSFTLWFDTLMEAEEAGEYLVLLHDLYTGSITPEKFVKSMADNLE